MVLQCPPLKGKVAKILTWRWAKPPEQEDELDHTHHDKPRKSVSSFVCSLSRANFNSMKAMLYFRDYSCGEHTSQQQKWEMAGGCWSRCGKRRLVGNGSLMSW